MASENARLGKEFMAKNKQKEGVVSLPNGIQYEVLRKGDGAQPNAEIALPCTILAACSTGVNSIARNAAERPPDLA